MDCCPWPKLVPTGSGDSGIVWLGRLIATAAVFCVLWLVSMSVWSNKRNASWWQSYYLRRRLGSIFKGSRAWTHHINSWCDGQTSPQYLGCTACCASQNAMVTHTRFLGHPSPSQRYQASWRTSKRHCPACRIGEKPHWSICRLDSWVISISNSLEKYIGQQGLWNNTDVKCHKDWIMKPTQTNLTLNLYCVVTNLTPLWHIMASLASHIACNICETKKRAIPEESTKAKWHLDCFQLMWTWW